MTTRIKYLVIWTADEDQTATIVRHAEDIVTGELLMIERMLTLSARDRLDDEPPSEFVMEEHSGGLGWGFDTTEAYNDFDAAYIAARGALGLPIGCAAPNGGQRLLRALRVETDGPIPEAPTT